MPPDATLPSHGQSDDASYARRLAGGFAALVLLSFGLITLGALVRANEAGLACPDWPLCFGEFVPELDLRVAFEWSHRVVAGSLSLLFVGLGVLALRRPRTREACGKLLAVAALLLGVQVLLGALTVWKLLAAWTVTSHLITGNAFAATLLWISFTLRDQADRLAGAPVVERSSAAEAPHSARAAVGTAAVLLVLQMVLGGLVASRYAGLACPDFPACREGLWFPTFEGAVGLQLLHRINGLILVCVLAATAALMRRQGPRLRNATLLALGLGAVQLCAGAANVLLRLPPEITGLHSALAAALVLTLAVAVRESWQAPLRA